MSWAEPQFSKKQVDNAGRVLAGQNPDVGAQNAALEILNNWRSSHSFPLNTFQMGLRNRSRHAADDVLIAQRLKRVPSIIQKLRRFPGMSLARMQDIGGCRAVLPDVPSVRELVQSYVGSRVKHMLVTERDYISCPKPSGYRGVHLVYRYRSERRDTYNGLQIEVQIRSRLQHAWATAVETVGTFLQQSLKASEGSERWLTFFALMSSAFALSENTPPVPGTPEGCDELIQVIGEVADELKVQDRLAAYGMALRTLEGGHLRGDHFFLLALRPSETAGDVAPTLEIRGYGRADLTRATDDYLQVEKEIAASPGAEAVLVAVESLDLLRRAYPNYFLDTQVFLQEMETLLGKHE